MKYTKIQIMKFKYLYIRFVPISKTKHMLFSRSGPRQRDDLLMISNNTIQRINCITFLGFHIDDKLNWQEHTNACKNKLFFYT